MYSLKLENNEIKFIEKRKKIQDTILKSVVLMLFIFIRNQLAMN